MPKNCYKDIVEVFITFFWVWKSSLKRTRERVFQRLGEIERDELKGIWLNYEFWDFFNNWPNELWFAIVFNRLVYLFFGYFPHMYCTLAPQAQPLKNIRGGVRNISFANSSPAVKLLFKVSAIILQPHTRKRYCNIIRVTLATLNWPV